MSQKRNVAGKIISITQAARQESSISITPAIFTIIQYFLRVTVLI